MKTDGSLSLVRAFGVVTMLTLAGRIHAQSYNGFGYSVSGTDITITNYTGPGGAVTIPSAIPGVEGTVTYIGVQAFDSDNSLTSVTIPSTVTSIGAGAFLLDGNLSNIDIPGSVTFIGRDAFTISGLVNVTIPDSITNIPLDAFWGCSGLTNVTLGSNVTSVGHLAFGSCTSLKNITLPESVNFIDIAAFNGCSSLTSVIIPSHVTNIGLSAFGGCSGLTSFYFQGDAPSFFDQYVFSGTAPNFSIYYPSTATGWSTPTWNGYPAQPYIYPPPQPILTLQRGPGTVTPVFDNLLPGTNYQLQISYGFPAAWTNSGAPFTAVTNTAIFSQPFSLTNSSPLFFRLQY